MPAAFVAGSPKTIVDRLNDMADKLHVGHVMLLCHYGNMPNETVYYNTQRFAREVIPKLQRSLQRIRRQVVAEVPA